jgi:Holliday junction resolvase RusA-like endonuclease
MQHLITATFDELPPSTNRLYDRAKHGVFKRPEVAAWQTYALWLLRSVATQGCSFTLPKYPYLSVTIEAGLPRKTFLKRDLDNFLKITLDTVINEFLRLDDRHVTQLLVSKRLLKTGETAFLTVSVDLDSEELTDVPGPQIRTANINLSKGERRKPKMAG